jgi:hypothetical protein
VLRPTLRDDITDEVLAISTAKGAKYPEWAKRVAEIFGD